ncbi:MAG: hypothetical protein PWR27_1547 [Petroclostridium sp.]|jgi:hypothetical protein|uniref:YkuS family protein n=1 Tax=Petroclostridium xylanilyticum TaxID=1792311 RepID=UPI000B98E692|nr:YkuS family protein [Petroclostridium xylanilyticum]MBZ4644763.1 hypothetical protein [Clostridia bacterium]MDK2810838.1 hypothetical protein [Petroclostridium sp.]
MVVAVQRGLESVKDKLRERGYDVVTFGEYNYPIDAVVYTGNGLETSYIKNNNMPNLASHTLGFGNIDRSYGVLLINATNKTIEEIDTILKRKVYSPLF